MKPYKKARPTPQSDIVEEQYNRDAARNGREAEKILTGYIQSHEESTAWIVEEIGHYSYEKTSAKHRAGIEKPDVVLYVTEEDKEYAFISLKCCKNFNTAFNQIKRCSVASFRGEFVVPSDVIAILNKYTEDKKKLLAGNYSQKELDRLLEFLNEKRKPLLASAFTGRDKKPKANWLLLHQWKFPNRRRNIGKKASSQLISMQKVLKLYEGIKVSYTKRGTITFGAGVTLQRKGGDRGAKTANDLQFKLRIKLLLDTLGNSQSD
jgi:hypothetical protein